MNLLLLVCSELVQWIYSGSTMDVVKWQTGFLCQPGKQMRLECCGVSMGLGMLLQSQGQGRTNSGVSQSSNKSASVLKSHKLFFPHDKTPLMLIKPSFYREQLGTGCPWRWW